MHIDAFQCAFFPVYGLVDIHPAEDGFALHLGVVEGFYSKSHTVSFAASGGGGFFFYSHSPCRAGPSFRASEKKQKLA